MKDLLSLRLHTCVARLGSISAAAREGGLSHSRASRIIAKLETSLGARLLSRITRAVVPTEAGSQFLIRVEAILDAVEEAQDSVEEEGELRGIVRISVPGTIGYREVIPRLPTFPAIHPQLRVQVVLEDQHQDLVRDAVDVSIRPGKFSNSGATADLAHHRIIGQVVTIDLQPPHDHQSQRGGCRCRGGWPWDLFDCDDYPFDRKCSKARLSRRVVPRPRIGRSLI